MKYYSIGEFSRIIGKTIQTLRNWDKKGTLKPHHITEGGTRYYSQEQVNHFLGLQKETLSNKKIIGYYRERLEKHNSEDEINSLKTYMYSRGYQFEIKIDNLNTKTFDIPILKEIINEVMEFKVSKIVVLRKDFIPFVNYDLIECICHKFGTIIEVIDNTETTNEDFSTDLSREIVKFSSKSSKQSKDILELINKTIINK